MIRTEISWFGFKIRIKQAMQIFIGSLIILLFSFYTLINMFLYVIYNLTLWLSISGSIEDELYLDLIVSWFPFIVIFGITLLLSLYSIIKCRKIAKNYNKIEDLSNNDKTEDKLAHSSITNNPQHCLNCGTVLKGHEKYCTKCGNIIDT
jgi:hypothetical protein